MLIPGIGTTSNHPELFGSRKDDDGESEAEQAQENAQGRAMERPHVGYSTQQAPDTGAVRLFEVRFKVGGPRGLRRRRRAARDRRPRPGGGPALVRARGRDRAGAGLLAAYLIGTRITAPIRRSAEVAARIDAGDLTPRVHLPTSASSELQVMAEALNHMLDRLATAFAAQREFVADASHELRTPLTVLRGQIDVMSGGDRDDGSLSPEELERVQRLMEAEIARLTRLVDDLLVLAQSDRDDFLYRAPVRLDELVTELWDGLSLIAERNFEIGQLEPVTRLRRPRPAGPGAAQPRPQRDHAHRAHPTGWCASTSTRRGPAIVRITVSDDGPGIAAGTARARVRALLPHRQGAHPRGRGCRARTGDRAGDRRGPQRQRARDRLSRRRRGLRAGPAGSTDRPADPAHQAVQATSSSGVARSRSDSGSPSSMISWTVPTGACGENTSQTDSATPAATAKIPIRNAR